MAAAVHTGLGGSGGGGAWLWAFTADVLLKVHLTESNLTPELKFQKDPDGGVRLCGCWCQRFINRRVKTEAELDDSKTTVTAV